VFEVHTTLPPFSAMMGMMREEGQTETVTSVKETTTKLRR